MTRRILEEAAHRADEAADETAMISEAADDLADDGSNRIHAEAEAETDNSIHNNEVIIMIGVADAAKLTITIGAIVRNKIIEEMAEIDAAAAAGRGGGRGYGGGRGNGGRGNGGGRNNNNNNNNNNYNQGADQYMEEQQPQEQQQQQQNAPAGQGWQQQQRAPAGAPWGNLHQAPGVLNSQLETNSFFLSTEVDCHHFDAVGRHSSHEHCSCVQPVEEDAVHVGKLLNRDPATVVNDCFYFDALEEEEKEKEKLHEDVFVECSQWPSYPVEEVFVDEPIPESSVPEPFKAPATLLIARFIESREWNRPIRVLLDTGSEENHIKGTVIPYGVEPRMKHDAPPGMTLAGPHTANREVDLFDVVLPEFSGTRRIAKMTCKIFDVPCNYDLIMGRSTLHELGLHFDFTQKTITWLDATIDMKSPDFWTPDAMVTMMVDCLDSLYEEEPRDGIKEAKYERVSPIDIAKKQTHLSAGQQRDLAALLSKFDKLFSGQLGLYPHRKLHLELMDGARPVHKRAYSVARTHYSIFKKELEHLCDLGVLTPCGASEWAAPSFIIPKKDGRVRWISDFRELNKVLKRKVYPLPRIIDVLQKRNGYKFFTKLDISMQYYTFELDDESKDLCIIVTPFGKFRYNRLPMGIKQSPDFAQEIMEDVLRGIDECDVYIDDVGCFDDSWEAHLQTLETVLTRLQDNGFTINPLKCEWAVQETDWLGYWLTPTGLKPWKKKIDAILRMQPPTTVKQLRSFIGAVTFYRDMWPRRSHILAPLTALTGKSTFTWGADQQAAFEQMKALIAEDALIKYPDHNKPFHVYTDASNYQLGAVIMQDDIPIAYFSRKLNSAQQNYTTIEKELLSVVECFKEYRTMLLGADIHVHTDHRNLTHNNLTSHRVLRWRLLLEEFGPTFSYIKGEHNVLADALSRVPTAVPLERESADSELTVSSPSTIEPDLDLDLATCLASHPGIEKDAFLHHPRYNEMDCPLKMQVIHELQQQDQELQQAVTENPDRYQTLRMGPARAELDIIVRTTETDGDWKICIPKDLVYPLVAWYHEVLSHIGSTRLLQTLAVHCYHPNLRKIVDEVVLKCDTCQRYKLQTRAYGELPPREADATPWRTVQVDTIGPWHITLPGSQELTFRALTIIDPVTNLAELIRVDSMQAEHVGHQFEMAWLSRYPKPVYCIYDQGTEFKGIGFQRYLQWHGIEAVPTTVKNPQANSVCERLHQSMANSLRANLYSHPSTLEQATALIDDALATASYANRVAIHRTLRLSPGAIAFRRDMMLDVPLIVDMERLREKRQAIIDEQTRRQNQKRVGFDYQPGQKCLILAYKPDKLEPRAEGPFDIVRVHVNGTVTIQRRPNVLERINIRRIRPYRQQRLIGT